MNPRSSSAHRRTGAPTTPRAIACLLLGSALVALPAGRHVEAQSAADATDTSAALDGLEFLIGEWSHTGTLAPASFGGNGGPFAGPVICTWGAHRTWLACDHWTEQLGALGAYAVHVVIRPDPARGGLAAIVVNSYGAADYVGRLEAPGRLVFDGGRSQLQRVSYERLGDGRIRFTVRASDDGGRTFTPHTDGMWEPTR